MSTLTHTQTTPQTVESPGDRDNRDCLYWINPENLARRAMGLPIPTICGGPPILPSKPRSGRPSGLGEIRRTDCPACVEGLCLAAELRRLVEAQR